jgi:hypothetical protein
MRRDAIPIGQLEAHREETLFRGIAFEDRHLRPGQQRRRTVTPFDMIRRGQLPPRFARRVHERRRAVGPCAAELAITKSAASVRKRFVKTILTAACPGRREVPPMCASVTF